VKEIQLGTDSSSAVREFLAQAMPTDHSPRRQQESRAYLTWAIEHLALEIASVGVDPKEIRTQRSKPFPEC